MIKLKKKKINFIKKIKKKNESVWDNSTNSLPGIWNWDNPIKKKKQNKSQNSRANDQILKDEIKKKLKKT